LGRYGARKRHCTQEIPMLKVNDFSTVDAGKAQALFRREAA